MTHHPGGYEKNQHPIIGMDNQLLLLYVKRMPLGTHRCIQGAVRCRCLSSAALKSHRSCHKIDYRRKNCPLNTVYPVVYLDCIVLKVRKNSRVINKSGSLTQGINIEAWKEQPSMWLKCKGRKSGLMY
ncbi:TPA: hypothetical protein JZG60_004617 [Escherichia coli]|nr:hypothetical protein [Escherichia coli]